MVQEFKYGLTTPNTRENGERTRPTAEESSGMLMVTYMKESGRRTRPTDTVSISMSMAPNTKDTGRMIFKMAKVWRAGKTAADTRVDTKRA